MCALLTATFSSLVTSTPIPALTHHQFISRSVLRRGQGGLSAPKPPSAIRPVAAAVHPFAHAASGGASTCGSATTAHPRHVVGRRVTSSIPRLRNGLQWVVGGAVAGTAALVYVANLEQVPYTGGIAIHTHARINVRYCAADSPAGRSQFNMLTPAYEERLGHQNYAEFQKQFRGATLAESHPTYRRVRGIVDRIIDGIAPSVDMPMTSCSQQSARRVDPHRRQHARGAGQRELDMFNAGRSTVLCCPGAISLCSLASLA